MQTRPREIVIAGASGFVGAHLAGGFREMADHVHTIGRAGADANWSDHDALCRLLDGADVLVNLAGKSVDCRYTRKNRDEILRSRLSTTSQLREAVAAAHHPPAVWLNASTATIYRHAVDAPMTETTGELGEGFSVSVARAWEDEFFGEDLPATRRVAMRMAIVLGPGSAVKPLVRLARLGLGGAHRDGRWPSTPGRRRAGTHHEGASRDGRQRFSWIHLDDVLGATEFLLRHPEVSGPVNFASPNPSDDRTLMQTLREVLGVAVGVPTPRWMLELGALALRTETELLLKSRWVLPEVLLEAGYRFRRPDLREALEMSIRGA